MRPLVVYDGDCAFCRRWVERWRARTGDAVVFRPLQHRGALGRLAVPRRAARRSVQLLERNGRRYQGADAVFRILAHSPRMRLVARVGRSPIVLWFARKVYRAIARHRSVAGRLDRLVFGRSAAAPTRRLVRWAFLRALGGVYLIAFLSLDNQLLGLFGSRGVAPIDRFLARLRASAGREAYRLAPSLLWLGSSDRDLVRVCRAGQACAAALMLGIAPRLTTVTTWAVYLSFVSVGQEFLSFQWDALLLETGLHGALVASRASPRALTEEPSLLSATLLRWLLSRFYFQSGLVKLASRDPTWRNCTACAYHYETQPLPTRLGWYAFHLPRSLQRMSTAAALGIELGVPFLVFAPRPLRRVGFWTSLGLQTLIAATGNYGFFNLLTMVLSLWALDDDSFRGSAAALRRSDRPARGPAWLRALARLVHRAVGATIAAGSLLTFARRRTGRLAELASRFSRPLRPFRSLNGYGLFAVMTTARPEIVIEGSDDGRTWRAYPFRYKPSEPNRAPRWVAPHQPRLDWQMWFAALRNPPEWFGTLLVRLLEGAPEVLGLLRSNPFPRRPPRYVRALLYRYRMTDLSTKRRTGMWWQRELVGTYFPVCTLAGTPRRSGQTESAPGPAPAA